MTIVSGDATSPVGLDFSSSVKEGFFWFLVLWQGISYQRAMCQIIVAIKTTCPIKSAIFFFFELCSNSFYVLVMQLLRKISSMLDLQVSVKNNEERLQGTVICCVHTIT